MERALNQKHAFATGLPPLHRILQLVQLWQQRTRTRHQLAALDARQLSDIGISHSERMAELNKPFWR